VDRPQLESIAQLTLSRGGDTPPALVALIVGNGNLPPRRGPHLQARVSQQGAGRAASRLVRTLSAKSQVSERASLPDRRGTVLVIGHQPISGALGGKLGG
jgi:hypothetical protein